METPTATRTNRTPILALLAAATISLLGTRLTLIALPWFVLHTTGSAAKTGVTAFVEGLAVVFAAFLGGTIIDRVGFKRACVLSDIGSGLAVATIPLLYHTVGLDFRLLLALVFVAAMFDTPGATARQSLLPDLAGTAAMPLERANAAYQAIVRLSQLAGPILAGVLIAILGASDVLWIDAATFAVSAAMIAAFVPGRTPGANERSSGSRYLQELADGLRFMRADRALTSLVVALAFISLIDAPFFAVALPVYAKEVFGDAVDLGVMMGALGGGAFTGVLVYGAVGHRLSRRLTLILGLLILSMPIWVMATEPPLAICAASLAVSGFIAAPLNPLAMTIFQERVPADLRGRVFGLVMAVGFVSGPAGMLMAGYALDWFGLTPTLVSMASAYLAITAGVVMSPILRSLVSTPTQINVEVATGATPAVEPLRPSRHA